MLRKLPLIAILAAFPPLATDMYLPAIPMLGVQWGIALSTINLSLVLFFVSFSMFLLIHGPLSDRFGRRPILLLGIAIFVLSSLLCALAGNVYILIGYRIFQGAGAAAASALSMAICKDLFSGKEREQVLAYVAVIVAIAPTVAPIIGGLILKWLSWPWIFVVQGTLGFIAMIGVYFMQEPLQNFNQVNLMQLMGRYGSLSAIIDIWPTTSLWA
jgi:DHA1 family bicyclomycin/chloramphenicol resistance-like MFS transporter